MTNLAYEIKNEDLNSKRKKALAVKKKNEKALKRKLMRDASLALFVIISFAFSYINGRAGVSKLQSEVNHIKTNIATVQKEIDLKEAKLEKIRSSKLVEEQAQTLLGMIYPGENDKIYINSQETQEKVLVKKKTFDTIFGALFR